jgi:hypothetical protein
MSDINSSPNALQLLCAVVLAALFAQIAVSGTRLNPSQLTPDELCNSVDDNRRRGSPEVTGWLPIRNYVGLKCLFLARNDGPRFDG